MLDAARTLFVQHGFAHVSMRQLAHACGYTPGAFYVHFKDKHDLFSAICKHDFAQFQLVLAQLQRSEPDALARIWLMGRGYLQFAEAYPKHYEMMFMTRPSGADLTPRSGPASTTTDLPAIEDPSIELLAFLARSAQDAINAAALRADLTDARAIAQALWAGLHGIASLHVTFAANPWTNLAPPQPTGELLLASLLRGLARNPATVDHLITTHPLRHARLKLKDAGTEASRHRGT
jgi:AcrR family transcriptional regulator